MVKDAKGKLAKGDKKGTFFRFHACVFVGAACLTILNLVVHIQYTSC